MTRKVQSPFTTTYWFRTCLISATKTLFILTLAMLVSFEVNGQRKTRLAFSPLPTHEVHEQKISGPEKQRYRITLKAREFVQIQVEQLGADVRLVLLDASGHQLAEMDSPNGGGGSEILSFYADTPKTVVIEVTTVDGPNQSGSYTIIGTQPRIATDSDRKRIINERAFSEGSVLSHNADQVEQAILRLTEALSGWRASEDRCMMDMTARQLETLKQKRADQKLTKAQTASKDQALLLLKEADNLKETMVFPTDLKTDSVRTFLNNVKQALQISEEINYRPGKAWALKLSAQFHDEQGDYKNAVDEYSQAIDLYQSDEANQTRASLLVSLAKLKARLNYPEDAKILFREAVVAYQNLLMPGGEGMAMNDIGDFYKSRHNWPDAERSLQRAEQLLKCSEHKDSRILNLISLVGLYKDLGNYPTANLFALRAKGLLDGSVHPDIWRISFLECAELLEQSGQLKKAIAFYERAIASLKKNDSIDEDLVRFILLRRMALACLKDGQKAEAIKLLGEAIDLAHKSKTPDLMISTLIGVGKLSFEGSIKERALEFLINAQRIALKNDDLNKVGEAALDLGRVYAGIKKQHEAVENFKVALINALVFGDEYKVADVYLQMMRSFKRLGENRLAVFFGKEVVNHLQRVRIQLRGMDSVTQKGFLRWSSEIYKELAILLIQENRPVEALQAIQFCRNEEFFESIPKQEARGERMALTEREEIAFAWYEKIRVEIEGLGKTLSQIFPGGKTRDVSEDEYKILQSTKTPFLKLGDELGKFLDDVVKDLSQSISDEGTTTPSMRSILPEPVNGSDPPCVTIYTIIAEDSFYILLVNHSEVKAFSNPTSEDNVRSSVQAFLSAIAKPPRMEKNGLARTSYRESSEVYNLIFKSTITTDKSTTFEAELLKIQPQVLLWSLDGPLRYIPVAALYDSAKNLFLVQRYQSAVFTRSDPNRTFHKPVPWVDGIGFGMSESTQGLAALVGVKEELSSIFDSKQGGISGRILLNQEFTLRKMRAALLEEHHSLVHIASHFIFIPGDAQDSYLLMGDTSGLTLKDLEGMVSQKPPLFEGVELLVLSACQTGAQSPDADGREILGLAELAQALGANAVMATQWKVSDIGAREFMTEFYTLHRSYPEMSKAEVLRRTQLNHLQRQLTRSDVILANPYYWAPFVLYGDFR